MHQGPTTKNNAIQMHRERKITELEHRKKQVNALQQEIQNLTTECATELEINSELQAKRDFLRQFMTNSFITLTNKNAPITDSESHFFEQTTIDEKSICINSIQTLG